MDLDDGGKRVPGWNDPIDPHRAYRRPADDQPDDQWATQAWYDALPPAYDPGDRRPHRGPERSSAPDRSPASADDRWYGAGQARPVDPDHRPAGTGRHDADRLAEHPADDAGWPNGYPAQHPGYPAQDLGYPAQDLGYAAQDPGYAAQDAGWTTGYPADDGWAARDRTDQPARADRYRATDTGWTNGYPADDPGWAAQDRADDPGWAAQDRAGDADSVAGHSDVDAGWVNRYPDEDATATRSLHTVRPAGAPDGDPDERRRLTRPMLLAGGAAAATLAIMIGVGAALLPKSSDSPTRPAAAAEAPTSADGVVADGDLAGDDSSPEQPTPPAAPPSTPANTAPTTRAAPPAVRAQRPAGTPTRTRTTAPASSSNGATAVNGPVTSQEQEVIDLVNQQRAANGCGALAANPQLMTAARLHSQDQAAHRKMSHDGSDGSTLAQRVSRAGYPGGNLAENVAYGYETPADVMDGWMHSDGHRRNILNCTYRDIGVGVAEGSDGRLYWTQDFGG